MSTIPLNTAWLIWLVVAAVGLLLAGRGLQQFQRDRQTGLWVTCSFASILWWIAAGGFQPARIIALANMGLAAFAVGAVLGFVFTSYSEEEASVGKIREWLVAGVSGLALAEAIEQFRAVRQLLGVFAPAGQDFNLIVGSALFYSVFGFFAMFLNRELLLNVLLEHSRATLRNLRKAAEDAAKPLENVAQIRPVAQTVGAESAVGTYSLGLNNESINRFVTLAEKAVAEGKALDFETVSKLGRVYLFRQDTRRAIPLLSRAIELRPEDPEPLVDLAEALGDTGDRDQAIRLLEKARKLRTPPPPRALRLLGYYLLWDASRLTDAIRFNEEYLNQDPNDSGAIFNIACAYAQLTGLAQDDASRQKNRANALEYLRRAIGLNDMWRQRAIELIDDDFFPVRLDPEFRQVIEK